MLSPAGTLSISPLECFVEASGTRLASVLPIRKAFRAHGQGQTPPCPPVRCRRRPFAASDCRSENRIWLADMFAHKVRRNRNFQRTEKGTKKAALMPDRNMFVQKMLSESSTAEPRRLPARCRRNSLAPFFVEERRTWTAEHRSGFRPGTGRAEAGSVRQSFLLQNAL